MSQALATITPSSSYIPLMAVQRRSQAIGYSMRAATYASGAEIVAAGLAARGRLRGALALPAPRRSVVVAPAKEPRIRPKGRAPINMLAPCSWRFLVKLAALRNRQLVSAIMGPSRKVPIVAARADAIQLVYQHMPYSMPRVGRIFDLDHTTVLHALRKCGSTAKLIEAVS